ncbi:hypothetical protein KIN20_019487 [Parelaphostrongylus tenuis]|uniref:Uncharacterized protein n=1 Tax=Parelaphostrongylus tenuis TaxID=148309 RepID=A0AAD5N4W5_PARTN|nr:hypothetical protein KIN20_019487 [Parelaphostrongylus tenuis]
MVQLVLTCPADEVRVKVGDDFDADSLAVGQQVGVGEVEEAEVEAVTSSYWAYIHAVHAEAVDADRTVAVRNFLDGAQEHRTRHKQIDRVAI